MAKNYTLTMTFSMEEPKDYEDFKWAILRAMSSVVCKGSKEPLTVQTIHLQYGEPQGLAMRSFDGSFKLPHYSVPVKRVKKRRAE